MRRLLLIPLLALVLVAGCSTTSNRNREQQRLAKLEPAILYKQGKRALRGSDYLDAINVFNALAARYPFTPEARQARLDIIYAYYRQDEKESAKDAAEAYIRENPTSPGIDYAWYLKGLIDFERMPFRVERWLNVDLSARIPKTATDSFDSMREVVEHHAQSPYAADARRRMVYLRNRLANYEMQIARHYLDRGAWVAAAQRANLAIEKYDGAPAMIEALRVMYRCYRELGYEELAQNTQKMFLENFPEEPIDMKDASGSSWWKFWNRG